MLVFQSNTCADFTVQHWLQRTIGAIDDANTTEYRIFETCKMFLFARCVDLFCGFATQLFAGLKLREIVFDCCDNNAHVLVE
jgi:hypothetical protein